MRFQAGPPGPYPRLEALEAARLQAIRLSRGNPLDARGLRRLAMIDDMLHNYYLREGRVDRPGRSPRNPSSPGMHWSVSARRTGPVPKAYRSP